MKKDKGHSLEELSLTANSEDQAEMATEEQTSSDLKAQQDAPEVDKNSLAPKEKKKEKKRRHSEVKEKHRSKSSRDFDASPPAAAEDAVADSSPPKVHKKDKGPKEDGKSSKLAKDAKSPSSKASSEKAKCTTDEATSPAATQAKKSSKDKNKQPKSSQSPAKEENESDGSSDSMSSASSGDSEKRRAFNRRQSDPAKKHHKRAHAKDPLLKPPSEEPIVSADKDIVEESAVKNLKPLPTGAAHRLSETSRTFLLQKRRSMAYGVSLYNSETPSSSMAVETPTPGVTFRVKPASRTELEVIFEPPPLEMQVSAVTIAQHELHLTMGSGKVISYNYSNITEVRVKDFDMALLVEGEESPIKFQASNLKECKQIAKMISQRKPGVRLTSSPSARRRGITSPPRLLRSLSGRIASSFGGGNASQSNSPAGSSSPTASSPPALSPLSKSPRTPPRGARLVELDEAQGQL